MADPNSPIDLIDLWNLRQFTASCLFPVNVIGSAKEESSFGEFIASTYRPIPGNPNGVDDQTTVQFGRSFSEERAKEVALDLTRWVA